MKKKKNIALGVLSIILLFVFAIGISQNSLAAQASDDICNEDCNFCFCEGNQGNIIDGKRTSASNRLRILF